MNMESKYFRPLVILGVVVIDLLILWGAIELVRWFL